MMKAENFNSGPFFRQTNFARLTQLGRENSVLLQTLGIGVAVAATGALAGIVLAKGMLAAKGVVMTAPMATTLLGMLGHKVVPFTAGAVGGGVVGWGVTQGQVAQMKERLAEQMAQHEAQQVKLAQRQMVLPTYISKLNMSLVEQDASELEQIHGIGPIFVKRLNVAGIFTLRELADQTPPQLCAIIAMQQSHLFNPQQWIEEARRLLNNRQVATQSMSPSAPTTVNPLDTVQATALITLDRLEVIAGIVPLFAYCLNRAGILTYADLAQQTPARIQKILDNTIWVDEAEINEWIGHARGLAANFADH